eukprot:TRINITY_DN8368_c0_g1_i1.p1 TRINITY_DN8368_c0_g1~~TRINITY_DN8368_c0_g1_i1.p1  ORF type:complete len:765 (-),score=199.17 TRINITY_DN8368_c0_g1_i1:75-2369(-)
MVHPTHPNPMVRKLTRKRTDKKKKEAQEQAKAAMQALAQPEYEAPKLDLEPHKRDNSMMVCLRVRPLTEREKMDDPFYDNGEEAVRIIDNQMVVVMDASYQYCDPTDVLRANRNREKQYAFHRAFDGGASQQDVYEASVRPVIEGIIDGINATIFAYGATGTGKTHTMIGNTVDAGITVLTVADLFDAIDQTSADKEYRLTMTYMEVYNETIRDLLNPNCKTGLELREDPVRGVCSSGITEVSPTSVDEVMELLHLGNKYRTTETTDANKTSSRSHAMMQICVEQQDRTPGIHQEVRVSKLSMIDLAGSERASQTNNRGIRMVEGANINRSLLALGNCINALGVNGGDVKFVPYRDSKLTRLLKDSLGGSCRTVMIATLSPCSANYEENINTLKYASRAINIRNKVTRNVIQVAHHISEYTEIIKQLRDEVTTLKQELGSASINTSITQQIRPASNRSLEVYDNLQNSVFEKFSERLDLIGSLADLQQESVMSEMSTRLDLGPLANHEMLPSIKDAVAGRARDGTPEPPMNLQQDEKHRKVVTDLHRNEQVIERVNQEGKQAVSNKHLMENLQLLCDNKMLESSNLELKRRVRLQTNIQQHNDMYVRLLENELRLRDQHLQNIDDNGESSRHVRPLSGYDAVQRPLDIDRNSLILPMVPQHDHERSSEGRKPRPGSKGTTLSNGSKMTDGSAKQLMLKRRQYQRAQAAAELAGLQVAGQGIEQGARAQGFDTLPGGCLLYTSDAADEEDSVDLGGRRLIKKTKI